MEKLGQELEQKLEGISTAPRITLEHVKGRIKDVAYFTNRTRNNHIIFIAILTLANGFTATSTPLFLLDENQESLTIGRDYLTDETIEFETQSGSVLRWGFKDIDGGVFIVGKPSASVSAENDNREIGLKIAIENMYESGRMGARYLLQPLVKGIEKTAYNDAFNKIWELEGYQLATILTGEKND